MADCTKQSARRPAWEWLSLPDSVDAEENVWRFINKAFSQPVTPDDEVADYAPTQIVAELFKEAGFDGVAYHSSLASSGHNVALFDLSAAEPIECQLHKVEAVTFRSKKHGDPTRY